MLIGYARVSTNDQHTALQLEALRRAGCERVYEERASGAKFDRPVLWECIESLLPGDQLTFYKLDRVARSLSDLLRILERVEKTGASIRSLTEPIDTGSPAGRLMLQILGAMAEFERSLIRERVSAGIAEAMARGVRFGPKPLRDEATTTAIVEAFQTGLYTRKGLAQKFGMTKAALNGLLHREINVKGRKLLK